MKVSEQKKRQRHLNRITLTAENFTKVDLWVADLKASKQGISISHNDLANWMLMRTSEYLTDNEKDELKLQFFDEVKFLKELLSNAKRAKASGEKVELGNLLQSAAPKRKYRKRKTESESTMSDSIATLNPQ